MTSTLDIPDFKGAMTLLRDCVGGKAGERLLIVSEPIDSGYYDSHAPKLTAAAGRVLGLRVYETESASYLKSEDEKALLLDTLYGFDHIVFFSRVGDQLRFTDKENLPSTTMCYTLNHESLNSTFGTACHHGMNEITQAINSAFENASSVRVTCPKGTDYAGKPNWQGKSPVEVTLKRFPQLVAQPIPSLGFTGKIALSRFLIGTGSRVYDPYYLSLPNDLYACVENNRIIRFDGNRKDVAQVEEHYKNVAGQFSIEPWHIDSWHAGIHPGCYFEADAESDIMRWSGTAFGNPRILHFHTCGEYAPGEISWHVLDPTIYLDDVAVWEHGQLHPDRLSEGEAILRRHPNLAELFADPFRDIGLTG